MTLEETEPSPEYLAFRARLAQLMGQERPYTWAKRYGIHSALSNIERRKYVPRPPMVRKMAEAIGCDPRWLATGEGYPFPSRVNVLGAVEAVAPAAVDVPAIRQTHQLGAVEAVAPAVVQAPPLPGRVDWSLVSNEYRREIRELLHDVVIAVDRFIEDEDLDVPAEKRAQLIALLFDYMLGRPNFQVEDVKAFFSLVA